MIMIMSEIVGRLIASCLPLNTSTSTQLNKNNMKIYFGKEKIRNVVLNRFHFNGLTSESKGQIATPEFKIKHVMMQKLTGQIFSVVPGATEAQLMFKMKQLSITSSIDQQYHSLLRYYGDKALESVRNIIMKCT